MVSPHEQLGRALENLDITAVNDGVYGGRWMEGRGALIPVENPATEETIATVRAGSIEDYQMVVTAAQDVFQEWRMTPAPVRGGYVRQIGDALRDHREELGVIIAGEVGKILPEGVGEVQEMIDIADFAVGLSRQLYGLTMPSERPRHRLYEQWHPLGPVGVITAFNFPAAVWSWNALIAAVCGDTLIWKPSPLTPLTAIAVTKVVDRVMAGSGYEAVFGMVVGDASDVGAALVNDTRVPLISATGSCRMGREVASAVGARLGRSLLELGGNNAAIVLSDADLDLVVGGVLFSAIGTAGQRCTSLRRLLLQREVARSVEERLVAAYRQIPIGDPLEDGVLMGPVIDHKAVQVYRSAIEQAIEQGGEVVTGGAVLDRQGHFVEPTIIRIPAGAPILCQETFAPILYLVAFDDLDEAMAIHNGVPQGLSSAIFTDSFRAVERFLSPEGSDCGLANINIGTSGAEIGGAFGGEKDTGGGRESGSDAWKAYMRRQTVTSNWGESLPLAQGITFD